MLRRVSALSLIEVVLAAAILGIALIPSYGLFSQSANQNEASINEIVFANLAGELVDCLTHSGEVFLQSSYALSQGNWYDVCEITDANERKKFILSDLPNNIKKLSFSMEQVVATDGTVTGYLVRIKIDWKELKREKKLLLARYIKAGA